MPTHTWVMSSWQIRWKLSWLRLRDLVLARGPRVMVRLEISGGGSKVTEGWHVGSCLPFLWPCHCTSWPRQAAVAQGEAVVTSLQRAALQGGPQLPHAGKGPVPALQAEGPCRQLNGELAQTQTLHARGLGQVAGWGQ